MNEQEAQSIAQDIILENGIVGLNTFGELMTMKRMRRMLVEAARRGALREVHFDPHEVIAKQWVCASCHQPVALKAVTGDRDRWVHVGEAS